MNLDVLARKRVFIGTMYLVALAVWPGPRTDLYLPGLAVALAGEAIRTWASGYIFKNEELARLGPYSIVRNPLYVGSFLLGLGLTLMNGQPVLIVIYPLLFLPIYFAKIRLEEQDLLQRFGDEARTYIQDVPRFFPNPALYRAPASHWDLRRMLFEHREWTNWFLLAAMASWFWYVLNQG